MKPVRRFQWWFGIAVAGLAVLLVANSLFLVVSVTPAGLVAPMQGLHIALGAALCLALPVFVASHFWLHRRHRNHRAKRMGLVTAGLAGLGCCGGAWLWWVGKSPATTNLVYLHELGFAAAMAAYLGHRYRAQVTRAWRAEWYGVLAIILCLAGIWTAQTQLPQAQNPTTGTTPDRREFHPGLSEARTRDGHVLSPEDLANPEYCQQCHPEIVAQWEASAHRHSSLNDPFYAATLAFAQKHRTPEQLKFCGGCHDPQLLLTGRMQTHPKLSDPGAEEGITCLACHAIVEAPGPVGNGSYVIAAPAHYPDHNSSDPSAREASNRLLRSKPNQHVESFAPTFLQTSEMCVACHKAHIPAGLNDHRWLRGQNEYDAWHDSGAGGYSARTFYPPGAQKRCQDCHMPRIEANDPAADQAGTVASHNFLGANTALAATLNQSDWQTQNTDFLRDVVSIDMAAIEVGTEGAARRRLAPSDPVMVEPGQRVIIDMVVRNRRSGHFYPGGTADLREAWLELQFEGQDGTTVTGSGWLQPDGNLDPAAHRWNTVLLDGEGNPLRVHDVEDAHVVLTSRRIMLGASDVVRVALTSPTEPGVLKARVLDRKFSQAYARFALGSDAPRPPVVVISEAALAIAPGVWQDTRPAQNTGARLRDLGIAHLLRGATSLAREASQAAADRLPDDPGPHLDLARIALADGSLEEAETHVREADKRRPGHPTAAWLLARIRQAQGNHTAAHQALERALSKFPRDRGLLLMQATSLFRLERETEAETVLQRILQIDPEHLGAHALLTKIYIERGDTSAAAKHQEIWDRVRPASADRVITERARQQHPYLSQRTNLQYILELRAIPDDAQWATQSRID